LQAKRALENVHEGSAVRQPEFSMISKPGVGHITLVIGCNEKTDALVHASVTPALVKRRSASLSIRL
jgi:hypothetical protein